MNFKVYILFVASLFLMVINTLKAQEIKDDLISLSNYCNFTYYSHKHGQMPYCPQNNDEKIGDAAIYLAAVKKNKFSKITITSTNKKLPLKAKENQLYNSNYNKNITIYEFKKEQLIKKVDIINYLFPDSEKGSFKSVTNYQYNTQGCIEVILSADNRNKTVIDSFDCAIDSIQKYHRQVLGDDTLILDKKIVSIQHQKPFILNLSLVVPSDTIINYYNDKQQLIATISKNMLVYTYEGEKLIGITMYIRRAAHLPFEMADSSLFLLALEAKTATFNQYYASKEITFTSNLKFNNKGNLEEVKYVRNYEVLGITALPKEKIEKFKYNKKGALIQRTTYLYDDLGKLILPPNKYKISYNNLGLLKKTEYIEHSENTTYKYIENYKYE